MKSIMEQASSIIKAIEKAWISADSPREFSVKIFEKEEKNFFGMTTKPAKIGIFFSNKNNTPETPAHKNKVEKKEVRTEIKETSTQHAPKHPTTPAHHATAHKPSTSERNPIKKPEHSAPHASVKTEKSKENLQEKQAPRPANAWNEAMINAATSWITKSLSLMGKNDIEFSTDIAGKNLKLTFNKPLIENPIAEKQLFRSIAHLVMSSLRNQYKQEIKDLKVVLIRPQ